MAENEPLHPAVNPGRPSKSQAVIGILLIRLF